MKPVFCIVIFAALILQVACTTPSYEELAADLLGDDPAKAEQAAEKLAADPKAWPRCAAALVVQDPGIRGRYMAVFKRVGDRAIPVFTDNIGTINVSSDHFQMFVTFFRERGDAGYQALLRHYDLHADAMKEAVQRKDYGISTMAHLKRMEDLGRVMMALPQTEVEPLSRWLTHPFAGVREQTAKILCAKGWTPPGEMTGPAPQVYYSMLSALSGCNQAEIALEKMVKLARKDLNAFLAVETEYPSPHGVFYRVLSEAATDEVVAYSEKKCTETQNEFLFVQYWRVLKAIQSPASQDAQKRLLARPDLPELLRAMIHKADQDPSAMMMTVPKK